MDRIKRCIEQHKDKAVHQVMVVSIIDDYFLLSFVSICNRPYYYSVQIDGMSYFGNFVSVGSCSSTVPGERSTAVGWLLALGSWLLIPLTTSRSHQATGTSKSRPEEEHEVMNA